MSNSHQGHRARKRFGQNFLHDENVIQRIIHSVNPKPGDNIVEIGPGMGALTELLFEASNNINVVELDRDLVQRLQKRFGEKENFHIHSSDALKFDFSQLATDKKLRIVGNLPYNISTPLLFHLMEQVDCVQDIHCMLQKEVVDRISAGPGENNYGRLSIMLQYYCQPQHLFNVPSDAFQPAPKVESAILRLTPHKQPPIILNDEKLFAKLVAQAFSQRRKTLRNCIKTYLTAEQIESVGINPTARPETLGLEEFAKLSNIAKPIQT